jgi:hypothetical protein
MEPTAPLPIAINFTDETPYGIRKDVPVLALPDDIS